MTKKTTALIIGIILLAIMVVTVTAQVGVGTKEEWMPQLISHTDVCIDDCRTVYQVCNKHISLERDIGRDIWFNFYDQRNNTKTYTHRLEEMYWVETVKPIYTYDKKKTVLETLPNGTEVVEWSETQRILRYKRTFEKAYRPITEKTLAVDECINLSVSGAVPKGQKIDNILHIDTGFGIEIFRYSQYAWWNNSFGLTQKLNTTLNNTAPMNWVPAYVNNASWNHKYCVAEGKCQSDGRDIRILNTGENTTYPYIFDGELNHENLTIITAINFSGTTTEDQQNHIYFNNTDAESVADGATLATLVNATMWFKFDNTTGQGLTSFVDGTTCSVAGDNNPRVSGAEVPLGYGVRFDADTDGAEDGYSCSYDASVINTNGGAIAVVGVYEDAGNSAKGIFTMDDGNNKNLKLGIDLGMGDCTADNTPCIQMNSEAGGAQAMGNTLANGEFFTLVATWNKDGANYNLSMYQNGAWTDDATTAVSWASHPICIGNMGTGGTCNRFELDGVLTELIVLGQKPSPDWIAQWDRNVRIGALMNQSETAPVETNVTITGNDYWTLGTLSIMNVSIDGNTTESLGSPWVSTMELTDTRLHDVIILSGGYEHWRNTTYNASASGDLTAYLWKDQNIYLVARDENNLTNVTTVEWHDTDAGTRATTNPLVLDASQWFLGTNQTTIAKNYTIVDKSGGHQNLTRQINITRGKDMYFEVMTQNALKLDFFRNGTTHTTEVRITNENTTRSSIVYNVSTFTIPQGNLTEGYVKVVFGDDISLGEWAQYYEYNNNLLTNVDEDLEVIEDPDWSMYVRVLDVSNSPLEDATVRVSIAHNYMGAYSDWNLIGQRLTGEDGKTFFIADNTTVIFVYTTMDGYTPSGKIIHIGDTSYTEDSPLNIYLAPTTVGAYLNNYVYIPTTFTNRTKDINGSIVAFNADKVEVQTTYRTTLGLQPKDITDNCNSLDACTFTLISGTDFSASGTDNINVSFYIDDAYWDERTVEYQEAKENQIFTPGTFSALNKGLLNLFLGIIIIVLSLVIGMVFHNQSAGKITFFTGCFLATFISTTFLWITIFLAIYIGGKMLKKVISE